MPGKNVLKQYLENGIYHIYNRGVAKQNIFLDRQDYATFLLYLKIYLENQEEIKDTDPQKRKWVERKNFSDKIDLLCFCLMPNHFHLILKQKNKKSIADFMRCIATNYSMYFNRKYGRVGTLFQGRYKAILIKKDEYLVHLSRYIHANPIAKSLSRNVKTCSNIKNSKGPSLARINFGKLEKYPYSSYAAFIEEKNINWVKPELILSCFTAENGFSDNHKTINIRKFYKSYKKFMHNYSYLSNEFIENLILEG